MGNPTTNKMKSSRNNPSLHGKPAGQSGVVLIVALIMLLLLTLVATTGMQTTSLEEKMAGNLRDKNLAFQAAESALQAAEASLDGMAGLPDCTTCVEAGTGGYYSTNSTILAPSATLKVTDDAFWVGANAKPHATSTVTTLGNNISAPLYIVQRIGCSPCGTGAKGLFKITVRATGGSTDAVVIVQSTYSPP